LNWRIVLGFPVFGESPNVGEAGEIEWEILDVGLLEFGVDGFSG
jgi:hypothetical protein